MRVYTDVVRHNTETLVGQKEKQKLGQQWNLRENEIFPRAVLDTRAIDLSAPVCTPNNRRSSCIYLNTSSFFLQSLSHPSSVCAFFSALHKAGSKHALCTLCHNSCPPARTKTGSCSSTTPRHSPGARHLSLCPVSHLLQSARPVLGTKLSLSTMLQSCGSSAVGQPPWMFCCVHVVLPNDRHKLHSGMYGEGIDTCTRIYVHNAYNLFWL
jgi:hypothetical protein